MTQTVFVIGPYKLVVVPTRQGLYFWTIQRGGELLRRSPIHFASIAEARDNGMVEMERALRASDVE